ncbi:hypothetical protein ES332_D11G111800v1 [Gossypium tomentosum]|uniref:MalT-like TPR region domain-containing protein n=1 Tax=Gossypium tomentosum TaxID=34277 RepID=A0A5D2ILN9_GOSTO|nr:hypothetical protein ES332_D11G111800v1 [Gossypium tomentosum]
MANIYCRATTRRHLPTLSQNITKRRQSKGADNVAKKIFLTQCRVKFPLKLHQMRVHRSPSPSPSVSRPKPTKRTPDKTHIDESSLNNPDLRCSGPGLELAMSLHVLAAIYSSLGRFEEAVPVLERSIEVPLLGNGSDHALAKFSGCMQLEDTYSMMGQLDRSINSYESGLRIQIEALGDSDPRTCRYLAEAHVQVVQFDEAESPARRPSKSTKSTVHQDPLKKQLITCLWLLCVKQRETMNLPLSTLSVLAYLMRQSLPIRRHLTVFKSTKGKSDPSLASVFIRLADLYNKTGKLRESKFYSENAFRIYFKQVPGTTPEEIAKALKLLEMAMKLLEDTHGNISTIARIEAQMETIGVYSYLAATYDDIGRMILLVLLKPFTNCSFARHSKKGSQDYILNSLFIYAIEILKYILKIREEKPGMENPNVDDEKIRLAAIRNRKGKSFENLLNANSYRTKMKSTKKWSMFDIRS